MDTNKFTDYLKERKLTEEQIEKAIKLVREFEDFLSTSGKNMNKIEAVLAFSQRLMEQHENTLQNYYTLIRYGRFIGDDEITIPAIELIDGAEALENLYRKLGDRTSGELRDHIFEGIEVQTLGLPNQNKTRLMQLAMERMEKNVDPAICIEILGSGLRSLEGDDLSGERKKYLACSSLDEFLVKKGDAYIAELTELHKDHKLYFTQEITQEVIDFVNSEPMIRQGVREGNILLAAKIPHHAKEYLAEKDEQKKHYHYCHCPWVKESLKNGKSDMPSVFCNCSAAFEKHYWEGVFAQSLQSDVLETVLQGDKWCKFAIHLPENIS